jgi:endonuclease/exonuclease/phosphatase family metal-dependent hydrolase
MVVASVHDQLMWTTRLSWTVGVVTFVTACAPSHMMRQGPDDGSCAARQAARTSLSPPVAVAQDFPTWSGPSEARDIRHNTAWCQTVGPPIVQATPQLRLEEANRGDSVAILTWNVKVGGADVVTFLAEELGLECEPDGRLAPEPLFHFVLLLQEVYRASSNLPEARAGSTIPWRIEPDPPPGGRLDVLEVAERCGLALFYVPSARNGPDQPGRPSEDKGNAILSTLPISDLAAIELPFEAGRKVAVVATIPGPSGERIRVVSVHLDMASTLSRTLISGNATRLRQALGLVAALESMESLTTVIGGDFNTWSASESTLKQLSIDFPESPAWDGRPTRGPFPPDHILFRTVRGSRIDLVESSYRRIDESYGSDHAARVAWLRGLDSGPFGHADQLGQGLGPHLLHDSAAMHLDRLLGDLELSGDDLIEHTGDHVGHNLVFP